MIQLTYALYSAQPDISGLFAGLGLLAITLVLAYFLWQVVRVFRATADREEEFSAFESVLLHKSAEKQGINLKEEMAKRDLLKRKNFRKKLEEEIYNDFFGNNKDKIPKK